MASLDWNRMQPTQQARSVGTAARSGGSRHEGMLGRELGFLWRATGGGGGGELKISFSHTYTSTAANVPGDTSLFLYFENALYPIHCPNSWRNHARAPPLAWCRLAWTPPCTLHTAAGGGGFLNFFSPLPALPQTSIP